MKKMAHVGKKGGKKGGKLKLIGGMKNLESKGGASLKSFGKK